MNLLYFRKSGNAASIWTSDKLVQIRLVGSKFVISSNLTHRWHWGGGINLQVRGWPDNFCSCTSIFDSVLYNPMAHMKQIPTANEQGLSGAAITRTILSFTVFKRNIWFTTSICEMMWKFLAQHVAMTTILYRLKGGVEQFTEEKVIHGYYSWWLNMAANIRGSRSLNTSCWEAWMRDDYCTQLFLVSARLLPWHLFECVYRSLWASLLGLWGKGVSCDESKKYDS